MRRGAGRRELAWSELGSAGGGQLLVSLARPARPGLASRACQLQQHAPLSSGDLGVLEEHDAHRGVADESVVRAHRDAVPDGVQLMVGPLRHQKAERAGDIEAHCSCGARSGARARVERQHDAEAELLPGRCTRSWAPPMAPHQRTPAPPPAGRSRSATAHPPELRRPRCPHAPGP